MYKLLFCVMISMLMMSCESDDVIDSAKDLLGIKDKFTAEINGKSWSADVRVVKKMTSPVNSFSIVGTSIDGQVIQITTVGDTKGDYSISLMESIAKLNLNLFIASYTKKVSDISTLSKATKGEVEITEIGKKDGKDYISGTFELTITTDNGDIEIKNGVFKELFYSNKEE
ncbi:hypothetical protein DMA11_15370 [Marinilabiliaceae bacterium JC017]|nr:hypothetical protein DMA11_15370 [Marinilabiliaceae bacterium JC017]